MCCTLRRYVGFLPWSEVGSTNLERLVPAKPFRALGRDRTLLSTFFYDPFADVILAKKLTVVVDGAKLPLNRSPIS